MSLRLVTPATAMVVTLEEAKAQLRVYHNDEDTYIGGLVAAANDWLGGENSWLGLSVAEQSWELTLNNFPSGRIDLPKPPLISVEGVNYTPSTNVETTLVGFRSIDVGVSCGGYILPAIGASWPKTNGQPGSVRIEFTAGYTTVPASIKHAALLLIAHWFENREAVTIDATGLSPLPLAVDALLMPYRSWNTTAV